MVGGEGGEGDSDSFEGDIGEGDSVGDSGKALK